MQKLEISSDTHTCVGFGRDDWFKVVAKSNQNSMLIVEHVGNGGNVHVMYRHIDNFKTIGDLWAVHVHGPDSILAAESKRVAEEKAAELNEVFVGDEYISAHVIKWPYENESHEPKDVDWTDIG